MKLEEFLQKLKQSPRDWWFYFCDGRLLLRRLTNEDMQCPITYIVGHGPLYLPVTLAVEHLGMDAYLAREIGKASDKAVGHIPSLRLALLEACGVAEV